MKRRIQLGILLLLWPTYAYFYQAGADNEASRLNLVRAFVEDGVFWVDPYAWNSADQIVYERDGVRHYYSGKAPGSSMLAALPFKLASELLWPLDLPEGIHWHAVVYATAITTVNLLSALAAAVMFGVCVHALGSAWLALFGVAAVWLGTILFPFSTLQFGHAQAAAFVAFAFALVYGATGERAAAARRPGWALLGAGFCAGFAVVIEYPTVILVALLGLYLLHGLGDARFVPPRRPAGGVARFVAGGLCAGALLAAYNLAAFGTLLYVPYEAYTQGDTFFQAHSQGVLGVSWPGLESFVRQLGAITVFPQRGLLYLGFEDFRVYATNPVLWIALAGIVLLVARRETRPEGVLAAAAAICMLVFNACYGDSIVYWGGGASVGPRHVVPMLPLLAIPLARTVRSLSWLFFPLLAVSVFYMLLATAVEPRVGYEFPNPARDLFAANWMEGHFSLNRGALFDVERRLLTEDSTAFNLGELAGLPGAWQLAPLLCWWLLVGGLLVHAAARADASPSAAQIFARPPPRLAPRLVLAGLALFAIFVVATPLVASALG